MLEAHDCLQGTFESVPSGIAPIGVGDWVSIPICRRLQPTQAGQLGRSFVLHKIRLLLLERLVVIALNGHLVYPFDGAGFARMGIPIL